jgi:hypothetical protein
MAQKFIPDPEFVTAEVNNRLTVYGWKLDFRGILAYGNTRVECVQIWKDSFKSEYGHEYNYS